MRKRKLDKIISQIAATHHTTPEEVRKEMQAAMDAAMVSIDPIAQAKLAAIPRKGPELTLEEFVDYLVRSAK